MRINLNNKKNRLKNLHLKFKTVKLRLIVILIFLMNKLFNNRKKNNNNNSHKMFLNLLEVL